MQIGMADSSECNFDEALTRRQLRCLLDREIVLNLDRRSRGGDDGGCRCTGYLCSALGILHRYYYEPYYDQLLVIAPQGAIDRVIG